MVLKVSKRGQVPPFIVMDVMRSANEMAARGENVLHLEVGQPGSSAPQEVLKAVETALYRDKVGYTDALGIPELREGISNHYTSVYGVDVPKDRIVVTTGSSGGFLLSFITAFEPGDQVGLVAPGYPAYRNILRALGFDAMEIPAGPETRFQPTPDMLDAYPDLEGLIVASPGNPTGSMIPRDDFKVLCEYCERRGIRLVSDEIYHGITYENPADTAAEFTDKAIIVNSFSKYFSMTGWRLGWLVVPEDMVRAVECLAQNLFISAPTLSQFAGVAALGCREELDKYVAGYRRNRDLLLSELPSAGFDKLAPSDGAFYIYADVSDLTDDSQAFCQQILQETGVALTPGVDFDSARGHQSLRFSYAGPFEVMQQAIEKLKLRNG